ncbi:TerD family protein [Paenibacillus sp. WQ 127069]|uniref:TerD family protein n=1 Tax=Paenibacillus baimaensis TaxID=2982185 RepID=A0ABT2USY5_9BACL|nr:TerD family protein [Paenibacillus sp. WQ 127069]MCU6797776.1 TerD family protein [Paenibacillus sp. WQ 127069]
MHIQKGQKVDINQDNHLSSVMIGLGWEHSNSAMDIDGAAFLLSAAGVCEQDDNLIFYGNPSSKDGAITHTQSSQGDKEQISIAFNRLPQDIQKIAITLTIYEGEKLSQHFSQVSRIYIRFQDPLNHKELFRFEFGSELKLETAIVVGELYLHKGKWKFNAIGSGFNGGLSALCSNYGIKVIEEADNEPQQADTSAKPVGEAPIVPTKPTVEIPVSPTKPVPETIVTPKPSAAPTAKPFLLGKIELKKQESVSIAKTSKVTAQLKWDNPKKDLDLYCFYVTKKGEANKIYYRRLGSSSKSPYIELDKDSRTGGMETVTIHNTSDLRYVLFAAYSALSNGIGSFKSMKARAVVDNHAGQTVTAPLLQNNRFAYWVAIAQIDFSDQDEMRISHVETYSKSGSENSPLLYPDGTFKMNVGPIEFK